MANDEVRIKIKIDSNSQELVLMKQQVQDLGKSFNDADSFANTFMKRINLAGHIYAGYQVLSNTLGTITSKGMEVNKEMQKLTNSLTMSSAVMMANNDIYGNAVSVTEKYQIAQMDAARTTELLQKANINTPHTMKQTVQIYDSMYFGMKKLGASTSDMVEITEKLSIAAGNKIGFDAFLSAMDGISTGTVEANSEMGRFLTSIGLSNEEIKNSSDVVQLFKDKLSGFQAIQDFETKMSNLENSTDMFAKNLMKIPFDYLESKLPGIAKGFDSWAKSMNEINIYLSNAYDLSTYDELINKQYQLLGQIKEVKDDKFMWDSDQKEKLKELNSELDIVFNKLEEIRKLEKKASEIGTTFDSAPIDKLVKDTLDPYGTKLDEINKKWQSNFEDMQKNGKNTSGVINAWTKDIADLDKEFADKNKKISDSAEKEANKQKKLVDELSKAYSDIAQIGMSDYNKSLISITEKTENWKKAGVSNNEILFAQSKLLDELNQKTQAALVKEDLSYYERLVQLKSDSLEKDIELASISYTQKTLDIQDMNRPVEEKEKLISLESELYSKTLERISLEHQANKLDEVSNSYQDMLDSQISLIDATNDWNSNLTGTAASLADIASATTNLSKLNLTNLKSEDKLRTEYEKNKLKFYDKKEKLEELDIKYAKDKARLDEQNTQAQINGYVNISGAMSQMFAQGTQEAAAFQVIEGGLAVVSGIRAILTQGSGDPYSAFGRMALMAGTVAGLLSSAKIAFNFGGMKTSESSDFLSGTATNDGTGTVLGDAEAQSESIVQSLELLADYKKPEFETLLSMNKYLANISNNIHGVSALIVQTGGYAFGEGFTATDSGWSGLGVSYKNINDKVLDKVEGLFVSSLGDTLGGITGKLFTFPTALGSKVLGSVINGIFGKTSTTVKLKDSGMYFADQLLSNAREEIYGAMYQTIKTTTTTKSWFSKSTTSSTKTKLQDMAGFTEIERQFSLILDNMYNSVASAGDALDTPFEDIVGKLDNFVVRIGMVSMKGLSGQQIQDKLTAIFGKTADQLAASVFPLLNQFQQVGEGQYTTMMRVASGMEEAEYYASRLGDAFEDISYWQLQNTQGNIGFEALLQIIENTEAATYGVNTNFMELISSLDSTAEELYGTYTALDNLRSILGFLKLDTDAISFATIRGAGSADAFATGMNAFVKGFLSDEEQLSLSTSLLQKEFQKLNMALPTSKDSFRDIIEGLDLSTESSQELYGRLIILSDGFAEVADATTSSIEALQTSLDELSTNSFDTFTSSLDDVYLGILSIKNIAQSFLQSINTSSSATLTDQLIAYNKLRDTFTSYFDANGVIKAGINQTDVNNVYSQISQLASSISEKDSYLKDSLINQFNNDLLSFNTSEDVIKVNIIDGLGELVGLNELQLSQLKNAAVDSKITNSELDAISGLSQTQKDGILEFVNNSSYFSTEDTLSSLNEYAKAQLEVMQNAQAQETASLSSSSFAYGDYIGKQEQIDISKLLGVSYGTAKPLIEQLQKLSISNDKTQTLNNILGWENTDTSYDLTKANQLAALSPYIEGTDISAYLSNIASMSQQNLATHEAQVAFESAKEKFNTELSSFETELSNRINNMSALQETYNYWKRKDEGDGYEGKKYKPAKNAARDAINENNANIARLQALIPQLYEQKAINGYMYGTSNMLDDQIAMFNQKEIVVPTSFSDGIRQGELSLGNNNQLVKAVENLTTITKQQAREIRQMKKILEEKGA